ncbi:hypothetical protein [Neisseria sp. Ec49-e6-T10]|uniref:hypothetical protein n=1 Tax=Neisseria sp. Ec49-e6-T10 TaxID=3140744 RepID=UPI003EBC7E1E
MKKIFLGIVGAFIVLTVVIGFFVADYLSKESDDFWKAHEHKSEQVTAARLEDEVQVEQKNNNIDPLVDDKNAQVLRIEAVSLNDKPISSVPDNNLTGSVSLVVLSDVLGRPKTVKPFFNDCGIQDVSLVEFGNIRFKKIQAEYFVDEIDIAGSKFELKTPRLLMNKDTKLEDVVSSYSDKAAIQELNQPKVEQASEVATQESTKGKKKTTKPAEKVTELAFLTSGDSNNKWVLSFNTKGLLKGVRLVAEDNSCDGENTK